VLNHSLEDQLILHEGLRLEVYKCPAGYWTVGVGRNLEGKPLTDEEQEHILGCSGLTPDQVISILKERGVTKDEALFLLANDIKDAVKDLSNFDWFENLDPVRKKVVIDMRYNLGPTRFRQFRRMIAALSVGDYKIASWEMMDSKWYHEVGNRSKRLVRMMATGEDYEK
jgi:lysozyme